MNQEFNLEKLDEIRNYLTEEINQNELMSKKHKEVCRVFNYIEHSFIIISSVTGYVCISAFAYLAGISIRVQWLE